MNVKREISLAVTETTIDQCESFSEFLDIVAEICDEKSKHVYGLHFKIWKRRAHFIRKVPDLVKFACQTESDDEPLPNVSR